MKRLAPAAASIALACSCGGPTAHGPSTTHSAAAPSASSSELLAPIPSATAASAQSGPPLPLWSVAVADAPIDALAVDAGGDVFTVAQPSDEGTGDFALVVDKYDTTGKLAWSRRWTGIGPAARTLYTRNAARIAVGPNGEVVIACPFTGSVDFGTMALESAGDDYVADDILVVKLDTDGRIVFGLRFGDVHNESLGDVAMDASGAVIVTGAFMGDLAIAGKSVLSATTVSPFILELGPEGDYVWSRRIGTGSMDMSIAIAPDGGVLVGGKAGGIFDVGRGPIAGIFVAMLAPDGSVRSQSSVQASDDGAALRALANSLPAAERLRISGRLWDVDASGRMAQALEKTLDVVDAHGGALWSLPMRADAVAFDPRGNLVVASSFPVHLFDDRPRGYLAKVGTDGRLAACGGSDECVLGGRCTATERGCSAVTSDDCKGSDGCKYDGLCTPSNRECIAATDGDCAGSRACKGTPDCKGWQCVGGGACSAADGKCVVSNAGCKSSAACAMEGNCALIGAECQPASDADCRASKACLLSGGCAVGEGDHGLAICVPGSARDCAGAASCVELGECRFVPQGNQCFAASAALCRASTACKKGGQCSLLSFQGESGTLIADSCTVIGATDCAGSLACKDSGYCDIWDGRPDVGCVQTGTGCAKSTRCRERGDCELVSLGGGDFPHTTCMPRNDGECAKSEDCAKRHRCHERGGACLP